MSLTARLQHLQDHGVLLPDPRQVFVDPDVDLAAVHPGVVLHPGTRLYGAGILLLPGAEVGTEGPATLRDAVLDRGAVVKSGYVEGAVLLGKASLGANAHVRPGTLLEEEASTAHGVGLKHTILLSYATMGSLINFCDALLAGGTSRSDHSEVGSGVIHFNFTPWGSRGDKATASLLGDVPRGVFLREARVFIGGSSGLVGPLSVGFGAMTAAGQVVRRDVAEGRLVRETTRAADVPFEAVGKGVARRKVRANLRYLGNLHALLAWYRGVRLAGAADGPGRQVLERAARLLEGCIKERRKRLGAYLVEGGLVAPLLEAPGLPVPEGLAPEGPVAWHPDWVRGLPEDQVAAGCAWLQATVAAVEAQGCRELGWGA